MTHTFDVAVIGCGAIGSSCAFQLAEKGLSVVVLEKAEAPAMGSTGKSAAGVRVQFSTRSNILLSKHSLETYREFPERYGRDIGYRPNGYLLLVPHELWTRHLQAVALQRELEVPVEVLAPSEIESKVPLETEGLAGATFGPIDGVVDPHWVTQAWVAMGRQKGVEYRFERTVSSIERRASWRLQAGLESYEVDTIVNAAGAWAGEVAALARLDLPVRPMRNMIMLSDAIDDPRTYPMTIDVGSGFYLRSEGRKLLFGLTNEDEPLGFTPGMNWPWLENILRAGTRRFPWLHDVGIDHRGSWWGYYEVTPDHNPIIGRRTDADNWIDVSGFSGHGIMHSPATGLLVAEVVAEGGARTLSIEAYRHDRFERDQEPEANIY